MDVHRFFDVAIVELVQENPKLFATLKGTLAIVVRGSGAWTIRFGEVEAPVFAGAQEDADLVLSFEAQTFEAFIAGTLDLKQALAQDRIAHDGDLNVVQAFSRFLKNT